jgi:hypothetical protein
VTDARDLSAPERERLERFAEAFDQLDAASYATLADAGTAAAAKAEQDALALLGSGTRHAAVRAAIKAFVDQATINYSRRMSLTDTLMLYQSLPDRADDRVRFLRSVERAVVAVILGPELSAEDRLALLGPWVNVVGDEGAGA